MIQGLASKCEMSCGTVLRILHCDLVLTKRTGLLSWSPIFSVSVTEDSDWSFAMSSWPSMPTIPDVLTGS